AVVDGGVELPFGPATELTVLGSPVIDDDPTLTGDQLELYFNSNRSGAGDIYVSTRASESDAWGAPQPVAELNTAMVENPPELALEGLTIWFASNRAGGTHLFIATRPARGALWSTPQPIPELATGGNEVGPSVLPDQLTMYLSSDAINLYDDLYVA